MTERLEQDYAESGRDADTSGKQAWPGVGGVCFSFLLSSYSKGLYIDWNNHNELVAYNPRMLQAWGDPNLFISSSRRTESICTATTSFLRREIGLVLSRCRGKRMTIWRCLTFLPPKDCPIGIPVWLVELIHIGNWCNEFTALPIFWERVRPTKVRSCKGELK